MQIQKRSDAYKITVSCGYDENGKQIRRTTTFVPPKGLTSKQEQKAVLEFAEDFERKVKGGANVQYNKMTFRVFCKELYFMNHLPLLKPKTASGYRIVIESRLLPYFGDMLIRNITPLDIRRWISSLVRKDGKEDVLSRNSIGVWFRTLSAVLGKAYEWELIDENPCIGSGRSPRSKDLAAFIKESSETKHVCLPRLTASRFLTALSENG